jgi:hypothetical protein
MRFKAALASEGDRLAWAINEVQKANTALGLLTGDTSPNDITTQQLSHQSDLIPNPISLEVLHR